MQSSNGEPVDHPALEVVELMQRCLGNLDLLERVVVAYQGQLVSDIEKLELALSSGDAEYVRTLAHRMKGAAANAGARGINAEVEVIERLANKGKLKDAESRLALLIQESVRFQSIDVRELGRLC